jgi:hypothetical protein
MYASLKKRMSGKLINDSYRRFCELIDLNELDSAAKLVVSIALITGDLFSELKHANRIIKKKNAAK